MHYDVIIVGGSFAGLAAALYLARARRSVCVIDAGLPRNRFADSSHGFLAQDGNNPQAMLATARNQISAYPTIKFIQGTAVDARKDVDGFTVALNSGEVLTSKKLLLAFGISDTLPDIPGLAERWGKSVIHCPYCHGYEFSDQKLGVLHMSAMSEHQAQLIPEWGPTTFYLNGAKPPEPAVLAQLQQRNVEIEPTPIQALVGDNGHLSEIKLQDGRSQAIDALFIGPRTYLNSDIAEILGCEIDDGPFGPIIKVDEMKMTNIADIYAAGDITRGAHNVTFATADGVMAAMAMHRSLVFDTPKEERSI